VTHQLLEERLEEAMAACRQDGAPLAVFVVALDGFAKVNDVFGHRVGDDLLHDLAGRLVASRRRTDTVARLGGDEFVVVCPHVGSTALACRIASSMLDDVRRPTSIEAVEHRLSASIGVVVYPYPAPGLTQPPASEVSSGSGSGNDGPSSDGLHGAGAVPNMPGVVHTDALVGDAAFAMRRSKAQGGGSWTLFDPTMREPAVARHRNRQGLRAAMENGSLVLGYEPICSLESHDAVGEVAVLGWRDEGSSSRHPSASHEAVDDAGLAVPVGRWVLDRALLDLSVKRAKTLLSGSFRVWVSVPAGLLSEAGFVDTLEELSAKHHVPPTMIGLDLMQPSTNSLDTVEPTLRALVERHVALSLDNFGSGSWDLVLLQRLPIAAVKLAPSLVGALRGPGGSDAAKAMIHGLVEFAGAIGLAVVACGVVSAEQVTALRAAGCTLGQGPYFGVGRHAASRPREQLWANGAELNSGSAQPAGALIEL
jgi:diguanylate cyclase (GGDEF)-like protein